MNSISEEQAKKYGTCTVISAFWQYSACLVIALAFQ